MTISKKQSAAGAASRLSRRNFLKGAGLAGVGGVALGAGMLADINGSKGVKAAEGEPIPIGGGVPLTGWAAADGIEFKRALEMACEEINAMGGILGRPRLRAGGRGQERDQDHRQEPPAAAQDSGGPRAHASLRTLSAARRRRRRLGPELRAGARQAREVGSAWSTGGRAACSWAASRPWRWAPRTARRRRLAAR